MEPASRYAEHRPTPELASRVACFWTLTAGSTTPSRILPDGCMDLLFDLTGASAPAVVGAMTCALVSAPAGPRVDYLGVRFRPGEAAAFLAGLPARGLRDQLVPLGDVWGRRGVELSGRLAELTSSTERVALVSEALRTYPRLAADARLRRAVGTMVQARGGVSIAAIARDVGMGERQLERLFDARVGVGPKMLASILRVQALLPHVEGPGDWARLAAELGYCDQAHLSRELGRLAGVTPSELARAVARRAEVDGRDPRGMSELSNPALGPLPMVTS